MKVDELERIAGQRLMVGFDGTVWNDDLRHLVADLGIGGIILFARNIETPDQVQTLIADAQRAAADAGRPPLLVAVDQEGGSVARLRRPHFEEFPAACDIPDAAAAEATARRMGRMLAELGFTMNMAPVVDTAPADMDSVMARRAFGADPSRVAAMGAAVIDGLQAERILAVAKHFPGIGRTTADSHRVQPVLDVSAQSIQDFDLPPFVAAIHQGAAGVMLSHIRYPALDPDWPASLSVAVARDLLREKLDFDGLVLTDDLDMGAVKPAIPIETAMERVLAADIDLALICHPSGDIERAHAALCRRMTNDDRTGLRAEAAWTRMMGIKRARSGRNGE